MSFQTLFVELQNLTKLKNNWYSVASVAEQLKIRSSENGFPARRLREAANVTPYSANTLNRMISVKAFLDLIINGVPELQGVDLNTLSFPSLEVVKRLHQTSREEGMKMLIKVVKGDITYRDLRKHYDEIMTETGSYSKGQLARIANRKFEEVALERLKEKASDLFKTTVSLRFNVQSPSYFADVIVEPKTLTYEPLNIGIIFETLSLQKVPDKLRLFIERSLTYGNFFDRFWIVFPSNANKEIIKSYIELLDDFGKTTYMVVLVPWEEQDSADVQIIREASGEPNPDLRGKENIINKILECRQDNTGIDIS